MRAGRDEVVVEKLFLDWELLIVIKWEKRMRKDGLDIEPKKEKSHV